MTLKFIEALVGPQTPDEHGAMHTPARITYCDDESFCFVVKFFSLEILTAQAALGNQDYPWSIKIFETEEQYERTKSYWSTKTIPNKEMVQALEYRAASLLQRVLRTIKEKEVR
jgi:hypothetical protein